MKPELSHIPLSQKKHGIKESLLGFHGNKIFPIGEFYHKIPPITSFSILYVTKATELHAYQQFL